MLALQILQATLDPRGSAPSILYKHLSTWLRAISPSFAFLEQISPSICEQTAGRDDGTVREDIKEWLKIMTVDMVNVERNLNSHNLHGAGATTCTVSSATKLRCKTVDKHSREA
ncbi:hypothetical protein EMCG_03752 [[Emmonsia] crescens]|uniref:Uncharacterized protein n=1 Tax=[Emmonsia] crescens TaxID=73230 RepID=A0A0G2HUI2_9EURO|nr:hypothetical protein EMCG_03752 [Emmonsia crescens UAMH 3008]